MRFQSVTTEKMPLSPTGSTPYRMEWAVPEGGYRIGTDVKFVAKDVDVGRLGGPFSTEWEEHGGRLRFISVPDRFDRFWNAEEMVAKGPWLIPNWSEGETSAQRLYNPMKFKALHREFAEL